MGLKLIKKGDQVASQIQFLSFLENPDPLQSAPVHDPPWIQAAASVAQATRGTSGSGPHGARPAAVDPALIEKLAYEKGFAQGEKAGMETAERKLETLVRRYSDAIAEVQKLKSSLYSRAEKDVVKLALEVAKKVVCREVHADREIVQTLVKVALSHVAVKSAVTVRLHPSDYNHILAHRAELAQGSGEERELVLVADKSIERGGCLIQSDCGDVDARIEEEFREVERNFFDIQEP